MSPPSRIPDEDDHHFMDLFATLRRQSVRVARSLRTRVLHQTREIDEDRLAAPSLRVVAAGIAVQLANLLVEAVRPRDEPGLPAPLPSGDLPSPPDDPDGEDPA